MAISKIGSKALVDCSVAAVDIEDGSITSAKLAGSIANAKLANSSITVNGTSVSLGASGTIPAVAWQSVITADGSTGTTAVAGNGYFIDTTSAAHTLTLPSSPSIGDTVAIKDYAGTFGTNNLTIARNSSNIQGAANDSLISTARASVVLVYIDSTKGWLYTVESNIADLQILPYVAATGGTVTTSGDYKIHTFTGDGCFVVSDAGSGQPYSAKVDYLVVAGGGGAGYSQGGGGGGGGFRESYNACVSGPYTASPLATPTSLTVTATTYPVTVGSGGGGSTTGSTSGTNGSNSVFSTITSAGGGGGGASNPGNTVGSAGGSGGGGGGNNSNPGGAGNTPPVSPSQGNPGGSGGTPGQGTGGGGGGAGATGGAGPSGAPYVGGTGGNGVGTLINPATGETSGCTQYYSGGGSGGTGGTPQPGSVTQGGLGGGGDGGTSTTTRTGGTANTGGGGGGGNYIGQPAPEGANGGKGIVIIRYKYQN